MVFLSCAAGYLKTAPLDSRKLGFGSHMCANRDEFTLHVRTEQYREQLKTELKLTEDRARGAGSPEPAAAAAAPVTAAAPAGDTVSAPGGRGGESVGVCHAAAARRARRTTLRRAYHRGCLTLVRTCSFRGRAWALTP